MTMARPGVLRRETGAARTQQAPLPPLWRYYLCYAIFMGVLFLAATGLGVWLLFMSTEGPHTDATGVALGTLVTVIGGALGGFYCAAPFVTRPRWSWTYHTVLIVVGLLTGVGLLLGIPLLIMWLRGNTRALFESGELNR